MSSAEAKGSNGDRAADAISRSSSITLVSSVIKDSVGEIASKLTEIDPILVDIGDASKESFSHVPDMKDLVGEISKLSDEVNKTKVDQARKIQAMKSDVRDKTKAEVLQSIEGRLNALITDAIASQVKERLARWGNGREVKELVGNLQSTVDDHHALLRDATIGLENSQSRHANSTIDVQEDFNMALRKIKLPGGRPSELFPENLRELFSYDADEVVRLIKEHGLRPLAKHGENLNRFLAFIGVTAVIPEQLIGLSSEEQLPAYGNGAGFDEEAHKSPRMGRRESSASQDARQNPKSSWTWF